MSPAVPIFVRGGLREDLARLGAVAEVYTDTPPRPCQTIVRVRTLDNTRGIELVLSRRPNVRRHKEEMRLIREGVAILTAHFEQWSRGVTP